MCFYLDDTSVSLDSIRTTSLPADCYSHNNTDLCQTACVNVTDDDVTFELARAHYVTGFTIHFINASDDILAHLSDAGGLAVEYKVLTSGDYTSATAKVSAMGRRCKPQFIILIFCTSNLHCQLNCRTG